MIRKVITYTVTLGLLIGLGLLLPILIGIMRPVDAMLSNIESDGYSGTILIAQNGEIIDQLAGGFASCDESRPNTFDTVYSIGSITKMFTAAARQSHNHHPTAA